MTLLSDKVKEVRKLVDIELDKLLPLPTVPEKRVVEAMRYASIGGGKALRPLLLISTAEMFGVSPEKSIRVATALEMIHSYSLIHDDLPAMDDDDLRRGKPSCHKAFDEATAILAGDGLLTRAFEILAAEQTPLDPAVRCELITALGAAAGARGMVGGQMLDLMAETDLEMTMTDVIRLQSQKTGRLLGFACEAGAILGKATFEERQALKNYASDIGLTFQITDDILDIEGAVEKVGKSLRRDIDCNKVTFVSLVGVDKAKEKARELTDHAVAELEIFGERAEILHELAEFILSRDH
ncbi:MAG: polyprenyl synthetase family protein [Alphaproteobacteria bacterium]|nr:polyprenyl synthetase family protein [Alphaproteobacteria bacterium]